jgi:hypothetical protein
MRANSIHADDIVCCNKRGRVFHAKVLQLDASGTLLVEPIERNISYRHVEACEITKHWALSTTPRRVDHAAKLPTLEPQLTL